MTTPEIESLKTRVTRYRGLDGQERSVLLWSDYEEVLAKLTASEKRIAIDHTCIHHTDAQRKEAGCPVCRKHERDQAIAEANKRDQKWMSGIEEVVGRKLDWTNPHSENTASQALEKLKADLKANEQAYLDLSKMVNDFLGWPRPHACTPGDTIVAAKRTIEELQFKLAASERAGAEMREALLVCQQYINTCDADALKPGAIHYDTANRVLQNALSTDAGKSYVKASELDVIIPILQRFTSDHARWMSHEEIMQDPFGAHALLERLTALQEGEK